MKKFLRFLNSTDNFEYFNAILRRRVSLLLDYDDYVNILRGDMHSFEQFLLDSRYGESYRQELIRGRNSILARIEHAVANHVSEELKHSRKIAEGEVLTLLEVILARADLLNSRLALRAFFSGSTGGADPLWHSYGSLPLFFFNDIWNSSSSISNAIEKCHSNGHPLALSLASALMDMQSGSKLFHAERTLLLSVIDHLRKQLEVSGSKNSQRVEEYLGMNIDLWNLGMWVRSNYGVSGDHIIKRSYIPGGLCFDISDLERNKLLGLLVRGTVWNGAIDLLENIEPRDIQRAMQRQFLKWQRQLYRANPLGIEVSLGYVARELTEWENLNLLAVGMASGVESEELIKRLIPLS